MKTKGAGVCKILDADSLRNDVEGFAAQAGESHHLRNAGIPVSVKERVCDVVSLVKLKCEVYADDPSRNATVQWRRRRRLTQPQNSKKNSRACI